MDIVYLDVEKDGVVGKFILIPPITSKQELLNALAEALDFPQYFGNNWDALEDLLCDFSWREEGDVSVFHTALRKLPPDDLHMYLEIVKNSMLNHLEDDSCKVTFAFDIREKEMIDDVMKN